MDLTTTLKAIITAHGSKAADLATATDPLNLTRSVALASGVAADQADQSWHDQRTLATAASDDLDLAGTLLDAFGDSVTFARVKAVFLENLSTENDLIVGNAAAATWVGPFGAAAHTLRLRPGGMILLAAADAVAYPVTADTADTLRLTHSGDTASDLAYRIVLIGATA